MGSTGEDDRTAALERRVSKLESRIEELEKRQQQGNSQQQQQSSGRMSPWFHLYLIGTSIAASLSLFSLFRDFIKIHQSFLDIINSWAAIVRPLADFLFSWIFELFGFAMPDWVGDYLVIGLVILSGRIRALIYRIGKFNFDGMKHWFVWVLNFMSFLAWPLYILYELYRAQRAPRTNVEFLVPWNRWFYLLLSPFIYFIILLLANYTAFFIWTGAAP